MSQPRRIAIVGAAQTGKTWLAAALRELLRSRGETVHGPERQAEAALKHPHGWVIADTPPLQLAVASHPPGDNESLYPVALAHRGLYELTLVTGLDLPATPQASRDENPGQREATDALLRQTLASAGADFRVVYGRGQARLHNALIALGLNPDDPMQRQGRENAQFGLNAGRQPWLCEKCSDPGCEHRLFTGLIRQA